MMTNTKNETIRQTIIDYFEGAGLDYYYWDKAFNMHFGYFKWGLNPALLPPDFACKPRRNFGYACVSRLHQETKLRRLNYQRPSIGAT